MPSFDSQTKKPYAKTPREKEKVIALDCPHFLYNVFTLVDGSLVHLTVNALVNKIIMRKMRRKMQKQTQEAQITDLFYLTCTVLSCN